jgi:DNA-binding transcriptional ArsR family regulator
MAASTLDVFQVVGDPSRRKMLMLLAEEKLTINSLADHFDMSRPAVSKHVKILNQAGFISIEDVGRERYCALKRNGFDELKTWVSFFDKFWVSRLNKLETLLNNKLPTKK